MLNALDFEKIIRIESKYFVKEKLNGRFREYVSDAYLSRHLAIMTENAYSERSKSFTRDVSDQIGNIAYKAAIPIFEGVLEPIGAKCNGHHVAQDFANFIEEISKI